MSWTVNFLVRLALAAVLFPIGGFVAWKKWDRCGRKMACAYFAVRCVAMALAVEVLGIVPYDAAGWHLHAGWMVADGLFPGRDFLTPYHLGFNGLLALCEAIWRSPAAIIVFFTLCEAEAIRLLVAVAGKVCGEKAARRMAILYLSSPICLMQSTFSAQDETLLTLSIGAFLYFVYVVDSRRGRALTSFLAVSCTKLIAPFYLLPFALLRRWQSAFLIGFAFLGYLATAFLLGLHPLNLEFGREPGLSAPADAILHLATSGNLASLFPQMPAFAWGGILAVLLFVTTLVFLRPYFAETDEAGRFRHACLLMTALLLEFMLLYPMTYSYYVIPVFPLMCLLAQDEEILPRRLRPLAVAWTFLFAFKDMLQIGCDLYGFLPGQAWVPDMVSALCAATTVALLAVVLRPLQSARRRCRSRCPVQ